MKKIYVFLFLLSSLMVCLILSSCSNLEQTQPFDPMESSIFKKAEVNYARALKRIEVKAGASEQYSTISVLNNGDIVRVLGKIDDWYVVRLENYQVGCIDSTKTEPVVKENQQPQTPTPEKPERPDQNTNDEPEQQNDVPEQSNKPAPNQPGGIPGNQEPEQPTTPDTSGRNISSPTNQESQLINLVNQERTKNALPTLKSDPELTRVARIKAQDMIDNNYFSHYSPTYGSPFDMMDQFGIDYQYAGENLSQNTSVSKAHAALMNSSGHRKNILSPDFTHIGVGIKKADRGYIYVEMFIGVPK